VSRNTQIQPEFDQINRQAKYIFTTDISVLKTKPHEAIFKNVFKHYTHFSWCLRETTLFQSIAFLIPAVPTPTCKQVSCNL